MKNMDEPTIRKWHRNVGIVLAPLILLQAISGMVIAFEVLLGIHYDIAEILNKKETHTLHYVWDYVLLDIHYGGGHWGALYHLFTVLGLIWLIMTGIIIFSKARRRKTNKSA